MNYIFDACALIAYIKKEQGVHTIVDLLKQAEDGTANISMSIVNLLEVYYGFFQERKRVAAGVIMEEIYSLPVHIVDTITAPVFDMAGYLKASYSISLADAFAAATALTLPATLVSKDHEFVSLEKSENLSVLWIN